ncbi:hypothetical protein RHECIAT_CH0001157 [Rhizobium etli CIAT 652]|uniref:Uncharacterized protein n=1 Tax=Rhizobium etli (strain CIAT 652) TaxID=491916 RepID=B3PSX2_RHIE6|nr:hypothetical protein RHECIAT_CH0001157 [Rhizobium etli CIAT 652]
MADVIQEGSDRCLCIAAVIGEHLRNLIINHSFADRLLAHNRAPFLQFSDWRPPRRCSYYVLMV